MSPLVLDSGGVTGLSRQSQDAAAIMSTLKRDDIWPPLVPSVVLVECLRGRQRTDALTNRFLKICELSEDIPEHLARRAAALRASARRGSAVDSIVVAMAEPGGTILTGDTEDLGALASYADDVEVVRI